MLISDPVVSERLLSFDVPRIDTGIDSPPEAAILIIIVFYAIAAVFNLYIPNTGVDHRAPSKNPLFLIQEFAHCVKLLWSDKLGQISLATTTLFWGAGATLQFIVIKWAAVALGYTLSQATMLQGSLRRGHRRRRRSSRPRLIPLNRAVNVVPVGIAMGVIVIVMIFVRSLAVAIPLMVLIGALAGFFVVPMNALLQHRGHILMGAGHSIAVQNFNENLSILVMLGRLLAAHLARFFDSYRDCAVRAVRRGHHVAGPAAASQQPAQRPAAGDPGGCAALVLLKRDRDW